MPISDIAELYYFNRNPQHFLGLLIFLLYLPFGIVLLFLRILLGIQFVLFGLILPDVEIVRKFLCKLLQVSLGIFVYVENLNKKEDVQVYVSNYITPFDNLVVHSITGSIMPRRDILNTLISISCGIRFFGLPSANLSLLKKNLMEAISNNIFPLYFQPENKQTNGKSILKFKTWYFEICNSVQPICLEVSRPLLDLKVSTFNSAYWMDIMGYLFSPCTNYTLRFLPIIEKMNLSEEEYASKVQQEIATALMIEPSEYSAADLLEWEKRIIEDVARREQEEILRPNVNSSKLDLQRMAHQVKEVLPMVPFNTIYLDLNKTLNTDQTITNILEGRVSYIPETSSTNFSVQRSGIMDSTNKDNKQNSLYVPAQTFGKSAQERMLSFQERKQQLINAARQRYIEKHELHIMGNLQ